MKLNNKGFAITLVLYGTLVLFILLIVSLLGILSTYKLRLEKLYPEVVPLSCKIIAENGYQEKQMLTINSSVSNVTYSWDKTNWGVNNVLKDVTFDNSNKTYKGYVKKNDGEIAECSIKLRRRKEYQVTNCVAKYSTWKPSVSEFSLNGDTSSPMSKSTAERNGYLYYFEDSWTLSTASVCFAHGYEDGNCFYRWKYTRSCWPANCGTPDEWTSTEASSSCSRKVDVRYAYSAV